LLAIGLLSSAAAQDFGFAAPRQFDAGSSVVAVAQADFDKDGVTDIASAETPHTVKVRRRNASAPGTPFASQTFRTESFDVTGSISDMAFGQLSGTAFWDIVVAADGNIVVAHNAGPG